MRGFGNIPGGRATIAKGSRRVSRRGGAGSSFTKGDISRIPPVRKVNADQLAEDMAAALIILICAVIVVVATLSS